ncbi:MAG: Cytochrome-c peroxidase [Phycisphaerales bacterium]|nr:Cytochrome-c peroxidase [Phycisphaerales bacterium]
MKPRYWLIAFALCAAVGAGVWKTARAIAAKGSVTQSGDCAQWEQDNPVQPLPTPPIGVGHRFDELPVPPTPQRVRLGRWLFYDKRLSADSSLSCASCHRPENAFSELTPHSTGIHGQQGFRKAPSLVNAAWQIYPNFFWDGRASSLEQQALGPIANPIEMGNTHAGMVRTLGGIEPYARYFNESFGSPEITADRVARAIADYERTRVSGNSPWDRWQMSRDESALSAKAKKGHELFFFGRAACNQCHLGPNFTDSAFHNLGVGFDPLTGNFKDDGRYAITKNEADRGSFKTPTLRDVAKHPPYLHDGSAKTLREVIDLYNRGGDKNPHLDPKMKPLNLTPEDVDDLVAFLESLNGEGYQDTAPATFPR